MLLTIDEQLKALAQRIQARRAMLNLTQQEAAARSGVSYRTWRRLETMGQASVEDLIRAAAVLRCDEGVDDLFPLPIARPMDELLARQIKAQGGRSRLRVRARRQTPPESV